MILSGAHSLLIASALLLHCGRATDSRQCTCYRCRNHYSGTEYEGLRVDDVAMLKAADHGDLGMLRKLLDRGANPNAIEGRHNTALARCACEGYLQCMKLLLERGANVNAKVRDGSWAALQWAANMGHLECVNLLLREGADSYINYGEETALMNTAECLALIERLKKKDEESIKKKEEYIECARSLLMHGANPDLPDKDGRTPRSIAPEVISELEESLPKNPFEKIQSDDIMRKIFRLLDLESQASIKAVCKRFDELGPQVKKQPCHHMLARIRREQYLPQLESQRLARKRREIIADVKRKVQQLMSNHPSDDQKVDYPDSNPSN